MEGPCFVNDGGMGAVAVREYPGQAGQSRASRKNSRCQ